MQSAQVGVPGSGSAWSWAGRPWALAALVLGVLAFRLAYVAWWCPYTLVEDEAHYWEWSRHLGLSYYTKGPGIAWTIHATTWLLGESEWGVRASSAVFGAMTAWFSAALAMGISGDRRAGFAAALAVTIAPAFHFSGTLMTIDSPYCALWAAAAWAAWRAMLRGWGPGLVVAGAAIGAAFLYKYTALLLLPGLLGYAIVHRGSLRLPRAASAWLMAALSAFLAAISPVLIWNVQEGWPTLRHLLGHVGVAGGDQPSRGESYTPLWNLTFLGYQVGLIGPSALVAVFTAAVSGSRRRRDPQYADPRARGGHAERMFLVWVGAPVLLFYFAVSFFTDGEGNWAMSAYPTLLALAGIGAIEGMDEVAAGRKAWRALPEPRPRWGTFRRMPENARQVGWHAALVYGTVACVAMLRLDWAAGLPLVGPAIPTGRLMGADVMGADAGSKLAALGPDAFVVAQHYGRASVLAFYMPGRPPVMCASRYLGGRRTQYDYWAQTSLERAELLGRPALLVGATADQWRTAFERVEELGTLEGDRKRNRPSFAGAGYRGFAEEVR